MLMPICKPDPSRNPLNPAWKGPKEMLYPLVGKAYIKKREKEMRIVRASSKRGEGGNRIQQHTDGLYGIAFAISFCDCLEVE